MDRQRYESVKSKIEALEKLINGGKGSGNFGHAGRPGKQGGSASEGTPNPKIKVHSGSNEMGYYYAEDGDRVLASGKTEEEALKKAKKKLEKEKKAGEVSLKGKSLYEKVQMIQPGDEVHITPKDNLPNFDRKIKVDYITDGTIHYGSSETSDGYSYPAWAIKDITKIVRKKNSTSRALYSKVNSRIDEIIKQENGGKGSGNFGHAGRPGERGGSSPAQTGVPVTAGKTGADLYRAIGESNQRLEETKRRADEYTPNPSSDLTDTGDSYWGDAKQGISLLDASKKDMVELARRQYGEDRAKQLKTEVERTRELLTMLPEDWTVRIDRTSPGFLETKLVSKYKIGDEFTIDGEIMKVVEGAKPGTIMGASEDKKRVARVPDKRLFELAQLESQTVLGKQNYEVIRKIAEGGRFNEKEAAERIIANIEEWSKKKKLNQR